MTNNTNVFISNSNSTKEFSFIDLMNSYDKIVIPKIQRDYAQGRLDKKSSDIRKNLLDDIFSGKEVKFDFIFGTKESNGTFDYFIPLDGQQRLTTLFLLYLYAQKKKGLSFDINLNKFSYDTRRASREFCQSIIYNDWDKFGNNKISDEIINSIWFLDYWQYDSTVSSMLNMLDSIHEHKGNEIFDFLDLNKIKFFHFDLNEHNLSENLYLKMNARGKPLTTFENFKAAIDRILPIVSEGINSFIPLEDSDNHLKNNESFKKKWQYCIDRQWADFFWNYKENNLIDTPFLRFVCNLLASYWIVNSEVSAEKIKDDKILNSLLSIKFDSNTNYISFDLFKKVFELPNTFSWVAKVLSDSFSWREIIIQFSKPTWKENESIDIFNQQEDNFKSRAVFFAFSQYCNTNYRSDSFKEWMRFAWNIAENHVSSKDEYIAFCIMISNQKLKSDDIINYLVNVGIENFRKDISGFATEQVREEIFKAKLIIKSNEWKIIIYKAEKHKLFRGCIRFLFNNYLVTDEMDIELFKYRYNKAEAMFNENGVSNEYKGNLLRALISQFNEWGDFWGIEYDNSADTWRKIFKNRNIALKKVLDYSGNLEELIQEQLSPLLGGQKAVHEDLFKSMLLYRNSIVSGCRLNYYEGKFILYPYNAKADWKKYVIGYCRNALLSELNVESTHKIANIPYYWGWDVNFIWQGKKFIWKWDNQIILVESGKTTKFEQMDIDELKTTLESLNIIVK